MASASNKNREYFSVANLHTKLPVLRSGPDKDRTINLRAERTESADNNCLGRIKVPLFQFNKRRADSSGAEKDDFNDGILYRTKIDLITAPIFD